MSRQNIQGDSSARSQALSTLAGDDARLLAKNLLYKYFQTTDNYLTRHHIDSFDQFLQTDLRKIIAANNPIMLLKERIGSSDQYEYKMELFVGGLEGQSLEIGTPTIALQQGKEVRVLFPNEARLRNLTYQSLVRADILIRVTFGGGPMTAAVEPNVQEVKITNYPLFKIPILLHSRYCLLNTLSPQTLREVGECPNDQGGYFIVDGAEKVIVTVQEAAFNTLYIKEQIRDPKVHTYASISCLSQKTRQVKRVTFYYTRGNETLQMGLPFVRLPVPIFIVFRALGLTSDKEIVRTIFPDENSEETKLLEPYLTASIGEAYPFYDTFSAIQYIKTLTKGFGEEHVLDIIRNQLFIHTAETGGARTFFLADCVRKILKRVAGLDKDTDRDDIRNQRCLTTGFSLQMLFQGIYKTWTKAVGQTIDKEYAYNPTLYRGASFMNIFADGNLNTILRSGQLDEGLKKSFKGKWGAGGLGEEKAGTLQAMSRLSYLDFLSHCRRVVLNFDTGMKLTQPRQLHTSQFGYFCTSETPGGASIGITKNLTLLAAVSTSTDPVAFETWLTTHGFVTPCNDIPSESLASAVPVYMNGGVMGFTRDPITLVRTLKLMKRTGCLPAYSSVGFNYADRRVFIFLDDGRPMRPLIHLAPGGVLPLQKLRTFKTWKELVLGQNAVREIETPGFVDPLAAKPASTLADYISLLEPLQGAIEYVDPYEQNEAFVASFPEHVTRETSHMEIHPSTIVSILTGMIPFANHNQSPRNQLSCSQSKQGISLYATNFMNRYDNTANILCYGEAPLVRTMYTDFLGNGDMPYGNNIVLAIGAYSGYNQEDGILINDDALQRGLFRSITFRTYTAFEENDTRTHTRTRIAHPRAVAAWTDLRAGLDYQKLDERGIVRVGEMVDENTVIVSRYIQTESGSINDASVTPQVWTHGRVESVVVTVNNQGLQLIKIRVTQDRIPELGDKFSNRHGQKGTIGMKMRGHDMPRTADGLVPDMIMNPHAIPSRMTIAQLLEQILGKLSAVHGSVGNGTMFFNEGDPSEAIGKILQDQYGFEPRGNQYLYNGQTGTMIPSYIFVGPVYTMRLKHMVEDKWNARGEGRRERRTHQPTGGRGNQGGLRIGEMERDAIIAHGISDFITETIMKRSDGTVMTVCNGCGTVPISNDRTSLLLCPLCDGPVKYIGDSATNLEILPPTKRSLTTFSKIAIPYASQLLNEELQTYMNIGLRYITGKYATTLRLPAGIEVNKEDALKRASEPLPERVLPETNVPEFAPLAPEAPVASLQDLSALGSLGALGPQAVPEEVVEEQQPQSQPQQPQQQQQNEFEVDAEDLGEFVPQQQQQQPQQVMMLSPVQMTVQPMQQVVMQQQPQQPQQQPQAQVVNQLKSAMKKPLVTPQPLQQQSQQARPAPPPNVLTFSAPQATQLLPAGFGAAPTTFVVDTTPQAMQSQGLPPAPQPNQRVRSPSPRPVSQPRPVVSGQGPPPPPSASTRVNIIKEGS